MAFRNLVELHRVQAERLGSRPAVRFKRHGLYHDLTWQRYREEALACAAALADAGIVPGDRVGLLAENRVEWLIADLGIMTAAAVNVPPHAPLTGHQVHFQLHDAGARWLFLSNQEQLEKLEAVLPELPALKGVVVFESGIGEQESGIREQGAGSRDRASESGDRADVPLFSWRGFLQRGRRALPSIAAELARRETALGGDSLATIMYTSGTTGNPKGVMLTHGNLLSNALAIQEVFDLAPDNIVLSWLPFSHIYARTVDHYLSLLVGNYLCLAESAETVVQNLEDVEPTNLNSVPRFYEKVLTGLHSADLQETQRNLRDVFGRRIKFIGSGGAPLPRGVAEAYNAAGLPLMQGYGLTESSPVISFSNIGANKVGAVGRPLPGVEVKIAADGEILTRGPHVMVGYWNNPQASAEALRDGWLCTGDLGRLDEDGYLFITGRKKEILVLSNGKKVVPSFIEGLLIADSCIDQAVVCGEGRNFLTALLVPHWGNVRQALRNKNISVDGVADAELARRSEVASLLQERIDGALEDVANWEKVKRFTILARPLTVADEDLTPSLKLRRHFVVRKYQSALDALYRD